MLDELQAFHCADLKSLPSLHAIQTELPAEQWGKQRRQEFFAGLLRGIQDKDKNCIFAFHNYVMKIVRSCETRSGVIAPRKQSEAMKSSAIFTPLGSSTFVVEECQFDRTSDLLNSIDALKNPDRILDAGCGATAVLALGAAVFHRCQVDALEIHPVSALAAAKLIELSGFGSYIKIHQADAMRFHPEHQYDAIVTETFNAGLLYEKGVSIFAHLNKFLKKNGVCIPQNIGVSAGLKVSDGSITNTTSPVFTPIHNFDCSTVRSPIIQGIAPFPRLPRTFEMVNVFLKADFANQEGVTILDKGEAALGNMADIRTITGETIFRGLKRQPSSAALQIAFNAGDRVKDIRMTPVFSFPPAKKG